MELFIFAFVTCNMLLLLQLSEYKTSQRVKVMLIYAISNKCTKRSIIFNLLDEIFES